MPAAKKPTPHETPQHTVRVPEPLDTRIQRAIKLAGYPTFTAFAHTAFVRQCREIEREHGLDADGNPVKRG